MTAPAAQVRHEPMIVASLVEPACIAEACGHGADECPTRGVAVCTCSDGEPELGEVMLGRPWPCPDRPAARRARRPMPTPRGRRP